MKPRMDYRLYLVTDSELMSTETVEESVELAVKGGCTVVQLREKGKASLDFYHTARKVKEVTDRYQVPLIINDRMDIALAVDADGVHVGQRDLPVAVVRRIMGNDKVVGVSVSNKTEAEKAQSEGADYLGVGAMFATGTKTDARLITMEDLKDIKKMVDLPIVVIGGINQDTIPLFAGTGIDGVAVISAIVSERDVSLAAKKLRKLVTSFLNEPDDALVDPS